MWRIVGQVVNLRRVVNPPADACTQVATVNSARVLHAGRPIDYRPQVDNLPHNGRTCECATQS
jgi:hypothetical protein